MVFFESEANYNSPVCSIPPQIRRSALHKIANFSRPGLWDLFLTFFLLGLQSFGGGSSTFFLIHQTCIRRGWMDEQEFVRTWALAQVTPGINLLKLTVLIGYKLQKWPGVFLAVSGLLAPTAFATALMTAGFALIRGMPAVQAVMKGVLPATIGLSLAMAAQMAQPLFTRAYREGPGRLGASVGVMGCAALLMATGKISPVLVLLLAGGITALLMAAVPARPVTVPDVPEKETAP